MRSAPTRIPARAERSSPSEWGRRREQREQHRHRRADGRRLRRAPMLRSMHGGRNRRLLRARARRLSPGCPLVAFVFAGPGPTGATRTCCFGSTRWSTGWPSSPGLRGRAALSAAAGEPAKHTRPGARADCPGRVPRPQRRRTPRSTPRAQVHRPRSTRRSPCARSPRSTWQPPARRPRSTRRPPARLPRSRILPPPRPRRSRPPGGRRRGGRGVPAVAFPDPTAPPVPREALRPATSLDASAVRRRPRPRTARPRSDSSIEERLGLTWPGPRRRDHLLARRALLLQVRLGQRLIGRSGASRSAPRPASRSSRSPRCSAGARSDASSTRSSASACRS